jgi:endonuclease YncB( thermonuclease family)
MSRRFFAAVLTIALVTTLAPAAGASHGKVHVQSAKVLRVFDGDTFEVDLLNDGTSKLFRVRVAGIQTMETGECHAAPATTSLARLIKGKTVRLKAKDLNSKAFDAKGGGRLLRFVEVKRNGRWTDVGTLQLQRSHALWHPHHTENLHDPAYHRLAVQASRGGKRLWNTEKCKAGPYPTLPLRMWVQTDAEGNDLTNVNGEWAKLHNTSATATLNLSGWLLRTAAGQIAYRIPRGTKIPPGETLTVHVGQGTDTALRKYWGRSRPIFPNVVGAKQYTGDGLYLYDRDLDLRRWFMYPCVLGCTDPLQGKIKITSVNYDAPGGFPEPANGEWVDITNISTSRVDLYGYLLDSFPYSYPFKPGTVLSPGETMRLYGGYGPETPLVKYWEQKEGILNNGGDAVEIRTFDYIRIDCSAWGKVTC